MLTFLCAPATALASDPTTADCLSASNASLTSGNEHELRAERGQLLTCASSSCPADVRKDCLGRVEEVNAQIPTIVFVAKDASGADLSAVKVTMDGELLGDRLQGTAVSVDPGEHVFVFRTEGQAPVTRKLLVQQSQKDRRELVTFGSPASLGARPGSAAPATGRLTVNAEAGDSIALDGKIVGSERFDGPVPAGAHRLHVTAPGKVPSDVDVDVAAHGSRSLDISLVSESQRAVWPWIAGGAALVVGGAAVAGYFLLRPKDEPGPYTSGGLGTAVLPSAVHFR